MEGDGRLFYEHSLARLASLQGPAEQLKLSMFVL